MRCYVFLSDESLLMWRHYNTRLTGLTSSKVPGFWMVEHQLVCVSMVFHELGKVATKARKYVITLQWEIEIQENSKLSTNQDNRKNFDSWKIIVLENFLQYSNILYTYYNSSFIHGMIFSRISQEFCKNIIVN